MAGTAFVPILLGVLCGMRRGEITALRWRAIDLERRQISIVASTEQTRDGIQEKPPKSVVLPTDEVTKDKADTILAKYSGK